MQKKKFATKLSAGLLAAFIVMQGMFPTVAVFADEISETEAGSPVIAETVTEPSETEETTASEPSETETSSETTETTDADPVETSEATDTEPTETTAPAETAEVKSSISIETAKDSESFSNIVASLSDSNRLIVQTSSDISNGIKNAAGAYLDGTYVISFADKTSYNDAVKFFDANVITYAEDGAVSLCSEKIDLISYGEINPNAKTKIAVIDTGSNVANEKYSVIGTDVSDTHGHGTSIANFILSETNDAYIISIKAIGSDGTGNVSDICAAVAMAQSMDVDVILMALSVRDNGDYDAFEKLVKDAVASGITVIASAGNNNADASAYLPAKISGVITVGAITEDGYKYSSSNYGSCVNYYVPATSTSQASALFAGKFIATQKPGIPP